MTPITTKNIKKFRINLKKRKALIGGWMQISNSNITEIMGDFKYDWIAFDMEHGSFSIKDFFNNNLKNRM